MHDGNEPTTGRAATPERILLVDDNPTNLRVLYGSLEDEGLELLVAQTGEEALEVAARAQPALILLDINMPGIDGFETCRRLKAEPGLRESVVIFLSARDAVEDKVQGLDLGAVDYIAKPFQIDEVVARVRAHLAGYRRERALAREAETVRGEETGFPDLDAAGVRALIDAGESERLEFKSTVRRNLKMGKNDKALEIAWLKTVVAFLNTDGGTVLLGVNDAGAPLGLDDDGFKNDDHLLLHVNNLIREHVGLEFSRSIRFGLHTVGGGRVLAVECLPAPAPAFLHHGDDDDLYVRVGPGSRRLSSKEALAYIDRRFES